MFSTNRPGMLYAALAVFIAAILFGGASRIETGGAFLTRLITLGAFIWLFWQRGTPRLRIDRGAAWLWAAMIALVAIQIIPLPYSWWSSLPGRDLAVSALQLVDARPWGAISLTPMRTLDALLMLFCAFVAYLLGAQLDTNGRSALLTVALGMIAISALLAIAQVAAGDQSPLYFYAITSQGAGVGFFSNANHMANFLCGGIVLAGWWLAQRGGGQRLPTPGESLAAAALVLLFLVAIFTTVSRAGAMFALLALGFALSLLPLRAMGLTRRRAMLVLGAGAVAGIAVVALLLTGVIANGAFSFTGGEGERVTLVPKLLAIARDFLPLGSGVGSFDPIYRSYEAPDELRFGYLNQAHNDYLQILIELGIPGLILLVAGLIWIARRFWQAFFTPAERATVARQQRAAAMVMLFALIHSAGDYPLRTDAFAVYFALLCAMLTPAFEAPRRAGAGTGGRTGRAAGPRVDDVQPGLSYSAPQP